MFELNDAFNNKIISRHRTMESAASAMNKHSKAVKRNNGKNSYIPYELTNNGNKLTETEFDEWERVQYGEFI